jgi:osmotically-inducible protein OsmY
MKRLFALVVLVAIAAAGLYYWRSRPEPPIRLNGVRIGRVTIPDKLPEPIAAMKDKLGDAAVRSAVQTAFALHRRLAPLELEVACEDFVVSLRGRAPDAESKATAERVARMVPEVKDVKNEIRVEAGVKPPAPEKRSLGEALDDEKLALGVRLALSLNRRIQGKDVRVSANRGIVTLTGKLGDAELRDLARSIAEDVPGVSSVRSELQ